MKPVHISCREPPCASSPLNRLQKLVEGYGCRLTRRMVSESGLTAGTHFSPINGSSLYLRETALPGATLFPHAAIREKYKGDLLLIVVFFVYG